MIGVDEFIDAIFGADEYVILAKQLDEKRFQHVGRQAGLNRIHRRAGSWYASISTYTEERRKKEFVKNIHAVVLDDIFTKATPPPIEPTWKIQSSNGNFQFGYALEPWLTDTNIFERHMRIVAQRGYTDKATVDCTRLIRIPESLNLKYSPPYCAQLTDWHPERRWDFGMLMDAMGVELIQELDVLDEIADWLNEHKYVLGQSGEWLQIICPWASEHTGGDTSGTVYRPLDNSDTRAYKCHHEHCTKRSTDDFLEWVREQDGPIGRKYDPIQRLTRQYAWVTHGKQVVDVRHRGDWQSFDWDEFRVTHSNRINKETVANIWLRHPKTLKLRGKVFDPGGENIIKQKDYSYFNVYKPPEWPVPVGSGSSIILDHIRYLLPDDDEHEYFLNWLAVLVQHPGQRMPMVLMVSDGVFGLGRSTLGDCLKDMLGHVGLVDFPTLCGIGSQAQYNEFLADRLLIITEEARDTGVEAGSDQFRLKAYEHLKQVVDMRPVDMRIKPKYGKVYKTKVYANFLSFSNHIDAIVIPGDDRRISVLQNPDKARGRKYFDGLYQVLNDHDRYHEELGLLFHALKNKDITSFAHTVCLDTPAKHRMVECTRSPVEECFSEVLEEMVGDLCTLEQFESAARRHLLTEDPNLVNRWMPVLKKFFKRLPTLDPRNRGLRIRYRNGQVRPRILRNEKRWINQSAGIAEELEKNESKPDNVAGFK